MFLSHSYTENMDSKLINRGNRELHPLFLLYLWIKTTTTSLIWVPMLCVRLSEETGVRIKPC